jgi:hypothetical protein
MNLARVEPATPSSMRQEVSMRAFTIVFIGAMLGAVLLATMGAVSTISQTRHDAIAFSLAGGIAAARNGRDRQPPLPVAAKPTGIHGSDSVSAR